MQVEVALMEKKKEKNIFEYKRCKIKGCGECG